MKNRNWKLLILGLVLTLALAMTLVACGGTASEPAAEEAAEEVAQEAPAAEEPMEEPTEAPAAEEPMEEPTEAPAAEEPMEEPTEEPKAEEPMEEPTEAPMEEPMDEGMAMETPSMNGLDSCVVADSGDFAGVDPTGTSIVWWHNHSDSREEGLNTIIEAFNESNACGITLEGQNQGSYDDIRNKVNASIAAGELPAALIVGYQNDQAFYQLNDALVDLNLFLNDPTWGLSEEDQADFYPGFFSQSVHPAFDNQRLGFPPNRSMEVMYYNETWMNELGFSEPPTTPEEMREIACAAAEANGDGTGGFIIDTGASSVAAWTFAFGGDVLAEDGTSYVYNSPATVEAMEFLRDMMNDGCAYLFTEGFPNPEFAARRAMFTMGSSSGLPFYASDVANAAEEAGRDEDVWNVMAIPHTTSDPVQNIYGGDVMVTATTPEQELAAWIFTKYYTSPEVMAEWVRISNYFPTRESTNEFLGDYVSENPQWAAALSLLPFSYYEPQLISYQAVRDQAEQAFNAVLQGADAQATLDELTQTANDLQAELMSEIE
jgi:multiple sugar transport system substrate-binding protein